MSPGMRSLPQIVTQTDHQRGGFSLLLSNLSLSFCHGDCDMELLVGYDGGRPGTDGAPSPPSLPLPPSLVCGSQVWGQQGNPPPLSVVPSKQKGASVPFQSAPFLYSSTARTNAPIPNSLMLSLGLGRHVLKSASQIHSGNEHNSNNDFEGMSLHQLKDFLNN